MSLSKRQQTQLRHLETGLRRADPHLGAMFSIFGRLYPGQDMAAWEQEPPASPGRHCLRRAAVRAAAALIATAAAIGALLSTAAAATAGWRNQGTGRQARTDPAGPEGGARQGADRDHDQGRTDDGRRRPGELP